VLDARGKAKAAANVSIASKRMEIPPVAVPPVLTDERGQFVFARVPAHVALDVTAQYEMRSTITKLEGLMLEPAETRDVVLRSHSNVELSGRVLDPSGKLVHGGRIEARFGPLHDEARIRADGSYYLPFVGSGKGAIHAVCGDDDADLAGAATLELEIPEGVEEYAADVHLVRTLSLSGRFLDAMGKPIARGRVYLASAEYNTVATSDADGRFRFEGLQAGVFELRGADSSNGREVSGVRASAGEKDVELRIPPAGSIRGRVVAPDVSLNSVRVSAISSTRTRNERVGADGQYVIDDLAPGDFTLVASAGTRRSRALTVTVVGGRESVAPDLELERNTTLRVIPTRAVQGATFRVLRGEEVVARGQLGSGLASVVDVPLGSLRVIVSAAGRSDEEHAVEAAAGAEALVRVLETP
jgi:hypothetical protein